MDFPKPDVFGNYMLKNFGDIVLPEAVPWWPLPPGWWVLLGLTLLLLSLYSYRRYRHWRRNAYRRRALQALHSIDNPRQLNGILKRAVQGAFPCDEVAPMWGAEWVAYLNSKTATPCFKKTDGEVFSDLLNSPESHWKPGTTDIQGRAQNWLRQHQEEKL